MCLTGVDYFSTLGYQPGIAALAAGALSPIATVVLVLLRLFGALPVYRRVAVENPHVPSFLHGQEMAITLGLVGLLGVVFLRGFTEAMGVAVALVGVYLSLNVVVIAVSFCQVFQSPHVISDPDPALPAPLRHGARMDRGGPVA
jgi:hypothetical protein